MAGLGAVGGHQRGIPAYVGGPGGARGRGDLVEVGGVGGDHVQRLVQVPVGGGVADVRGGGEGVQVGAVAQPAQHQQHLGVHRGRPLPGPSSGTASMGSDQPVTDFRMGAGTSKRARWATVSSRGRGVESLARPP